MTLKAVMNGGGGGGQKTVLITGVSRGLGKALAIELAKRGHFVIGCSRSQPASLQSQLPSSSGQEHLFLTADVSSNSSVQELARTVMEKKGVPDIIVNNAGTINKNNRLWEVPEEEFNTVIDTNIKGIANMLRHFIPLMIERKQGVIVNMSSGWGRSAAAQVAPYCASKWAVEGLTKSVAKEVPSGMAIVALNPGVINTDMLASCFGSSSSLYQAPDSWAPKAADMILNLSMADNGSSLSFIWHFLLSRGVQGTTSVFDVLYYYNGNKLPFAAAQIGQAFRNEISPRQGQKFSEIVGSPYYMAPEVFKRNYGPEVDIWSAGVILYILLCGVPLFWPETEQGVALLILRGNIDFKRQPWPQISENAKSLVKQMLQPDPKKRLTSQQVLEHPWIQNEKKASNVPLGDIVRTRLKQFSVMNRFKKKALRVIAEHLSIEEVEVIKDMFTLMDSDGDGKVTFDELKAGLRKVGSQLADPEIKLLMDVADVDNNGVLEYGEFVAVTIHLQKMENDEHLRRAFMFFDKDGSGYIELDELEQVLYENGQADIDVLNQIVKEVDTDKDGRISFEEFVAMMKAGTDWRKASRQYSRERFNNLSVNLMKDGSLRLDDGLTGQSVIV